ncbi:hypothetical protein DFO77_12610 [Marinilabilia salmonicolor]|uniref:Uncharacterized protein n=1 Tax=Marinilabilia salmonicolor TaxID=989 RepID=A0A368ULW1_9BACT|nr:hypothetical protein DFO77_12610 [Marinilabilia salmonicolor]
MHNLIDVMHSQTAIAFMDLFPKQKVHKTSKFQMLRTPLYLLSSNSHPIKERNIKLSLILMWGWAINLFYCFRVFLFPVKLTFLFSFSNEN